MKHIQTIEFITHPLINIILNFNRDTLEECCIHCKYCCLVHLSFNIRIGIDVELISIAMPGVIMVIIGTFKAILE